jgi:hypothetical protein
MQADPNGFGALVGQRANVNIFAVTAFFQKLRGQMAKLINGIGKVDPQNAAATKHSFIVVPEPKDAKSLFLAIPISADAFKTPGTIV